MSRSLPGARHALARIVLVLLPCAVMLGSRAGATASEQWIGPTSALPAGLLRIAPAAEGPRHVLVAEKSTQALFVYAFDRAGTSLARVYPCTTGKVKGDKRHEGDLKTPEGVYWFYRRIGGDELPPLYGAGALVMDYPNHFDRRDGKTGSGIWLHGVETNDRVYVANDTRGCVAVRNDHFDDLRRLVTLRDTPILIVESLELLDSRELSRESASISALIEDWRRAWEERDFDAYIAHYGDDFRTGAFDRSAWEMHKRSVAELEGERNIAIDDISILREKDRVWVTFRQEYASATHHDVGIKTLYLVGSNDAWRIVGEGWREVDEPFRVTAPAGPGPDVLVASAAKPDDRRVPADNEETIAASAAALAIESAVSAQPEGAAAELAVPALAAAVEPARAPEPGPVVRARPARIARGPFRLAAPWARADGEFVTVATQLLSSTPSTSRSGILVLKTKSATVPEHEIARERFNIRQGRDVEARIAREDLPSALVVLVLDESGKLLLDQDLDVTIESAP